MPRIESPIETAADIKVIGVGGSGKNAVNHMINLGVEGVEYICMNTDAQDLHYSKADKKIHLGRNLTRGLGTGMDPETGCLAAEETRADIQESLKGADMVFIACGFGGGTGTGASPIIARASKEQDILTVAVVTRPFSFEGEQRRIIAERGLEDLKKEVDAIIVISNDQLLSVSEEETTFAEAFRMADDVLRKAVQGISDLITNPGIINIDFADIRAILKDAGTAFMGMGTASGENRSEEAAYEAINSPLLDMAVAGASRILFSITGGDDLKMSEVNEAAQIVTESTDTDARVIFGSFKDTELAEGELKVTVIAAGFNTQESSLPGQSARPQKVNTMGMKDIKPQETKRQEKEEEETVDDFIDDNDWSNVPAFLRKKKNKD